MKTIFLSKKDEKLIEVLVEEFKKSRKLISTFLQAVLITIKEDESLKQHVHSIKYRIKDPEHLRDKLKRKIISSKEEGKSFEITKENLLEKINDLAGIRILHLYTAQISDINPSLKTLFYQQNFNLIQGPFARTWDDEYRDFFLEHDIDSENSKTMYTSVHYVIESTSRKKTTCEIQVRTLSEEVWGEVDHQLNYPHKTESLACSEQLKVLARVTSSVSRLVDSIFRTDIDHKNKKTIKKKTTKKKTTKKK